MNKTTLKYGIGISLFAAILILFGVTSFSDAHGKVQTQFIESGDSTELLILTKKLMNCDRYTDHKLIAKIVDEVRFGNVRSESISEILSSMLPHNAEIYQNKDKWEVLRLRSYILLTLSEIGFSESAMPMLIDGIAFIDERMKVVEVGAAIHALGNLGSEGNFLGQHIIKGFNRIFSDEEFSLQRYDVEFPRDEATTVQLEIINSLGKICHKRDEYAIEFLTMVLENPDYYGADPRLVDASKSALDSIKNRPSNQGIKQFLASVFSRKSQKESDLLLYNSMNNKDNAWKEAVYRTQLSNTNISYEDHDGKSGNLNDIMDKPVLMTFFYTRCQNDRKCSATIAHLAGLQNKLAEIGLSNEVRLLAITFEPDHDSPMRLKRYATDRGVRLGTQAAAIKLDPCGHLELMEELVFPVGYNGSRVNSHGVEAILLDRNGRIVNRYNSIMWNTSEIIADFSRLLKEAV